MADHKAHLHVRMLSRVTTCTGFVISVLVICFVWVLPSFKPEMPYYRRMAFTRRRRTHRRASSFQSSVRSSTSALSSQLACASSDSKEGKTPKGISQAGGPESEKLPSNTFKQDTLRPGTPTSSAASSTRSSLIPFARRMSPPSRNVNAANTGASTLSSLTPVPAPYIFPLRSPPRKSPDPPVREYKEEWELGSFVYRRSSTKKSLSRISGVDTHGSIHKLVVGHTLKG